MATCEKLSDYCSPLPSSPLHCWWAIAVDPQTVSGYKKHFATNILQVFFYLFMCTAGKETVMFAVLHSYTTLLGSPQIQSGCSFCLYFCLLCHISSHLFFRASFSNTPPEENIFLTTFVLGIYECNKANSLSPLFLHFSSLFSLHLCGFVRVLCRWIFSLRWVEFFLVLS